jgi:hypothetical protein
MEIIIYNNMSYINLFTSITLMRNSATSNARRRERDELECEREEVKRRKAQRKAMQDDIERVVQKQKADVIHPVSTQR